MLKGKHLASDSDVHPSKPPTSPARPSQTEDLSVDELKQLLLAKILSEADTILENIDLVDILRSQTEQATSVCTKEHFETFKHEITSSVANLADNIKSSTEALQQTLQTLSERVSSLEDTCKSQAQTSKRKHDDQDDPDRHEGEKKRQRMYLQVSEAGGDTGEKQTQGGVTESVGGSSE